jgi:RNA polymerase sigma factor (sigma-70 family)
VSSQEFGPEWVLSQSSSKDEAQSHQNENELISVAARLWPRVQAHARRELAKKHSQDGMALATNVWEGVLQSVAKTLHRRHGNTSQIADLEAYLFGAFHHRFNRALKKERRRQETIELVASTRDLEQLPGARDTKSPRQMEQTIQVQEVMENMDDWTRRVWIAKQYGFTWKEIGDYVGLREQAAKTRFHNALRKLAARLGYGK